MNNTIKPKVAILLATYNGENFIDRQIRSVLSQKNVDLDLFISDDNSEDRTMEICKIFAKFNKNIFILEKTSNRFKSAAKNFFRMILDIDLSKYDYIGFSDQDDIWKPFKINKAINVIQSGYNAYSSNVRPFIKKKLLKTVNKSDNQVSFDYLFEGGGAGSTYLIKQFIITNFKILLKENKWIQEKIKHHDWLLYAFTRHKYRNWFIDEKISVYYRQHSHNELGSSDSIKGFIKRLKLVINGHVIKQSRLIAEAINIESSFYEKLYKSKFNGFFLICNFYKFRRSIKGKIIILIIGILLTIYPNKKTYD